MPHDGKAESFTSLMNMLAPTAIVDPSDYTKDDIEGLYVRRLKCDVADQLATRIPERTIHSVHAEASPEEERAFTLLSELSLPHLDARATGGILFKTGLEKALFSSPAACLEQLRSPLRRKLTSDALPEGSRETLLDREQTPTSQALGRVADLLGDQPLADDLRALRELAAALEAIDPGAFSKYQRLKAVLAESSWSPRKKDDRLVIFTEPRETLRFLADHLPADLDLREGQWEELHGGLADVEQQRIVEDFGKETAKVRVLLASDVASEGLNLHYLSHRMVHFDVPWSLRQGATLAIGSVRRRSSTPTRSQSRRARQRTWSRHGIRGATLWQVSGRTGRRHPHRLRARSTQRSRTSSRMVPVETAPTRPS